MKKRLQSVALCSLALLLILGLGGGVVGLAFRGVSIVRTPTLAAREGLSLAEAELSASWYGVELDPSVLYDRACRQTVYLYWEEKTEDGSTHVISGSGIIISTDGYILTNAHCVSDAKEAGEPMQVELFDGRTLEGRIVGADTETDVALLKVETLGLPAASLSSEKVKGCQTVYVMGHPDIDLKFTMTKGIVSGTDRTIEFSDGTVLDMFQLDAAVNPGNSGGPAYDAYGRVVGMVTAKFVSITNEGLGFAIPIQSAVSIAEQLKEYGYVPGRPLLGIVAMNVTKGLIREDSPAGVMVYSAEEGLPGDLAGFVKGDIIVSLDGREIGSLDDLTRVKRDYKAGDTVLIRFWRDGEYLETYLTFAEVTLEHPVGPVTVEEEEEGEEAPPAEEEAEAPAEEAQEGAEAQS